MQISTVTQQHPHSTEFCLVCYLAIENDCSLFDPYFECSHKEITSFVKLPPFYLNLIIKSLALLKFLKFPGYLIQILRKEISPFEIVLCDNGASFPHISIVLSILSIRL